MVIISYKDLDVWQRAIELCEEIYKIVKLLPKDETYALSDQMRRAAVSVPSNIAEGNARSSLKEYLRFVSIAIGSNAELNTQLIICEKIGYLTEKQLEKSFELSSNVARMLMSLRSKLSEKLKAEQL